MRLSAKFHPRPAALEGLENLPQRVRVVPNNATAVKDIIKEAWLNRPSLTTAGRLKSFRRPQPIFEKWVTLLPNPPRRSRS